MTVHMVTAPDIMTNYMLIWHYIYFCWNFDFFVSSYANTFTFRTWNINILLQHNFFLNFL